jgi:hypothetical protein
MNEKQVEKLICKYAKDNGVMSLKLSGPNNRGKPDQMFLYKGKTLFLEMKGAGKKPTKLQLKWLEKLRVKGFWTGWVDNVADGQDHVDDLVERGDAG